MLGQSRSHSLIIALPGEEVRAETARRFCADFLGAGDRPKYVLGRNVYAESVAKTVDLTGFIDDYVGDDRYLGCPVVRTNEVPENALVLIAAGGKPLTAKRRLDDRGLQCLDYFAFRKWSGLSLTEVVFNEGFAADFLAHEAQYEWLEGLLADDASRMILRKLVSFRLKYDLALLAGFESRESEQYFEDFLQLRPRGETFVDIGGYDGDTSLEFIRRCPGYSAVHVFEPEPHNYRTCVAALGEYANCHLHQMGLSDASGILRLAAQGSGSRISADGPVSVVVGRLDDVLGDAPTFIKMDIEGAEEAAIEGARTTIKTCHPRLAISVYHRAGDFWRIPRQVLALRDDYRVYLRHYTESIYETVMFFVPRG